MIDTSPEALDFDARDIRLYAFDILRHEPTRHKRFLLWARKLETIAAEKRAAGDGITDEVVTTAYDILTSNCSCESDFPSSDDMRAALQAAVLALQGKNVDRLAEASVPEPILVYSKLPNGSGVSAQYALGWNDCRRAMLAAMESSHE